MNEPDNKSPGGAHAFELIEAVGQDDHSQGPDDASIIVVEYGDFECPNCKQAASAVKLILAKYATKLRFVFRHFPVEQNHPHAIQAAEAAEIAAAHGKFWEMHDLLFRNQAHLQHDDLRKYAQTLNLDLSAFDSQLDGRIYLPVVRKQLETGRRSGVRSTPAFFVNGKIHDVSFGIHSLVESIDKALHG